MDMRQEKVAKEQKIGEWRGELEMNNEKKMKDSYKVKEYCMVAMMVIMVDLP